MGIWAKRVSYSSMQREDKRVQEAQKQTRLVPEIDNWYGGVITQCVEEIGVSREGEYQLKNSIVDTGLTIILATIKTYHFRGLE